MNGIEVVANIIEAILETQFFVRYFGCKEKLNKKVSIVFFIAVHFAIMCICNYITYISDYEMFVMLIVRWVLMLFLLNGRILEKIFIAQIDTMILQTSSIVLTGIFDAIIKYDSSGYMEPGMLRVMLLVFAKLIYIMATEMILRNQIKDKEYVSDKTYVELNVLVFALLIAFNFLLGFIYSNSLSETIINNVKLLLLFLSIVEVMIYVLFTSLINKSINLVKTQIKVSSYKQRVNDVQKMRESGHQMAKINHDINKKLSCIKFMLDEGKVDDARDYLDDILEITMSVKKVFMTDNLLIDAVLNNHLEICDEKGINSTINFQCNISSKMEMDVAVMLANLLDNAVEAVDKAFEKKIEIVIGQKENYLCVLIKNTFQGILKKQNGKLLSIKDNDGSHGYGLINVEDIVNKYEGIYEYNINDNIFSTKIMLFMS